MIGSIEKRGKNSWRLVVRGGRGPDGKWIKYQKTVKFLYDDEKKGKKEAEKELALFVAEVEKDQFIEPSKLTFSDFVNKWIEDYGKTNLAPKTLYRYEEMLNKRILPCMGHLKLNKIKPLHLLEFYNNLTEDGIRLDSKYKAISNLEAILKEHGVLLSDLQSDSSVGIRTIKKTFKGVTICLDTAEKLTAAIKQKLPKTKLLDYFTIVNTGKLSDQTIKHHHRLISAILEKAIKWQMLSSNPADRVEPPKVSRKETPHYDEEQTINLIKKLENEPIKFQAIVYLALYAQLREGEIIGLEWKDIDFKECTIRVRQAAQYLPKKGVFIKAPKNETSKRTVTVPNIVLDILKKYRKYQLQEKENAGTLWIPSPIDESRMYDFVFTTWEGKLMHPYTPTKWFKGFIEKYRMPPLTFHGLRHTGITLLLSDGADIDSVSRRAGHSQRSTTLNIYSHSIKSKDKANADRLGNLLNKNTTDEIKNQ